MATNKDYKNKYTKEIKGQQTPTLRRYRHVTPKALAQYTRAVVEDGQTGVRAALAIAGDQIETYDQASNLATNMKKKLATSDVTGMVQDSLVKMLPKALHRLGSLVDSENEQIATKNVHYLIDRVAGQATKKVESINVNLSAQMLVADNTKPPEK